MFELHTFLFADLVDFTRFTARHGDERAAELAVRFHERVGALAAGLGCQLVKTIGDGVMVRASNSDAAVELARRIVRLAQGHWPTAEVSVHQDLAGLDRVVRIQT